jgi:hypothetical protein
VRLHEKLTMPLYPPTGATVSVVVMVWPAGIVAEMNWLVRVKSGMEMVMETALDVLGRLAMSPV